MGVRKLIAIILALAYIINIYVPAYGYNLIPEYFCETGIKLYQQGKLEDALVEFKKALVVDPYYQMAHDYIDLIENAVSPAVYTVYPGPGQDQPPQIKEKLSSRENAISNALDRLENIQPAQQREHGLVKYTPSQRVASGTEAAYVEPLPTALINLDQSIKDLRFPLEVEKDKFIIIRGQQINKFLVTNQEIVKVDKINPDEISVQGMDYGYTYLHVWDNQGRWTLEILGVPPKFINEEWEEQMRLAEERASGFKLRYSMDWSSLETGRRLNELRRSSYAWNHWLTLNGPTPYGDIDSQLSVRSLSTTTDLTYFTLGLENGQIGNFKDFSIRGFDFSPNITNLAFSSSSLRGVKLNALAFDKKLGYTAFWGREGGGRYAGLSPGLSKIRNSFLSGLDINYSPFERQNYEVSVFKGWGRDRLSDLNGYGYDFKFGQGFDHWKFNYEIANDSERFAHLFTTTYSIPKFRLISEFRNTDKQFHTMTGGGWRAGEFGLLTNLSYAPTEKLDISSRLDVYLDRLYPNPEDNDRWNQDLDLNAVYTFDQFTSLRADYSFQNELGRLSPLRTYNAGVGLYRTLDWFRRINTYVNYRHQESKHYSAPSNDFINEKVIMGLRFNLINDVYYYLNRELNWLEARYEGVKSQPNALETGIDWNKRIFNSPFYSNVRFTYRDEEDTVSPLSFLSGEDYIEGYAELSYRPSSNLEAYCSARIRNIWAENPDIAKRIEANFYSGLRYNWDIGIRWDPIGTISGVVFKDYNYDGIQQKDEPGIEGIALIMGKRKEVTDTKGAFKFTKVKAKKATIGIETSSIPAGFVLTTPATNEVIIRQSMNIKANFGLTSRTEITGMVFVDVNNNGGFDSEDKGVKDIALTLENGSRVVTDDTGRYIFNKVSVGKHTVKLDLNSLPTEYIPTVEIYKEVDVSEGASYINNIPLAKQAD